MKDLHVCTDSTSRFLQVIQDPTPNHGPRQTLSALFYSQHRWQGDFPIRVPECPDRTPSHLKGILAFFVFEVFRGNFFCFIKRIFALSQVVTVRARINVGRARPEFQIGQISAVHGASTQAGTSSSSPEGAKHRKVPFVQYSSFVSSGHCTQSE